MYAYGTTCGACMDPLTRIPTLPTLRPFPMTTGSRHPTVGRFRLSGCFVPYFSPCNVPMPMNHDSAKVCPTWPLSLTLTMEAKNTHSKPDYGVKPHASDPWHRPTFFPVCSRTRYNGRGPCCRLLQHNGVDSLFLFPQHSSRYRTRSSYLSLCWLVLIPHFVAAPPPTRS